MMLITLPVSFLTVSCSGVDEQKNLKIDMESSVRVPTFELPISPLLSEDTLKALKHRKKYTDEAGRVASKCPAIVADNITEISSIRQCHADAFYTTAWYKSLIARYDVIMTSQDIGGVYTEVFTPEEGLSPENRSRVLINLHGGGFRYGSYINSHLESIPISSVGKIKVVSIDYRMAPEHQFPAASEDVAAVYRELLKTYKPENIGIYGCSAGGTLAAQSMAWFRKEGLPMPGAIGMFCAAAKWAGDSTVYGWFLEGYDFGTMPPLKRDYLEGVDRENVLVSPLVSDEMMRSFPPSLLISSTRDVGLSSVVATHSKLRSLGKTADLHVWEGLGHAFMYDPNIPESREVYDVITDFFDQHLGR
ncbi:alpha/beta hydrolase [Paremcibacter congregatus]|uniref:alpha/beta hydrolase n=1 Tax=Paremcibacter congregatus TaxID=2043170 RepID=UPI003A8D179A